MAVPTEKEHRRFAVGSGQLKPPRCGLIGDLHLRDHAGERSITKAVFCKRQDLCILATLGIEDIVRAKPGLLKARRIKIEARHRPEDGKTGFSSEARRDPGREEGGARIVGEARRRGGDLMQTRAIEAMIGKSFIDLRYPERQCRSPGRAGMREACAKRGKLVDPVLVEGGDASGHGNNDSTVPHMFL